MAEEKTEETVAEERDQAQVEPQAEDAATAGTSDEKDQVEATSKEESADDEEISEEELAELRANEVAYSWQASEYVHNHKGAGWYWGLTALLVVLTGAAALLHYWLEIVAFLAMGGAIFVYARRPPRTLLYELTSNGVKADGKEYPYTEFRSFGVLSETEWHTIDLEPTKRFSPRMTILFEDDDYDIIVEHLELHLPRVDRDPDVVEWLTRLLRF